MPLNVVIKKLDGSKLNLSVDEKETIVDVKKTLAEKAGLDFNQLRLIHKGKPLADNLTITEAKIAANDMLHLILQLRA